MSIISIQTVQAGLVGVIPSLAYIATSDPELTILTTGYLNHEVQQGTNFSMPCMAVVSTQSSPTAQPQVGWYQVAHVGTNWSLISINSPGDVTLPTIANRIAVYTNTIGGLSEDAATATNAGNIAAGLATGTAGSLISYPGTGSKGSLILKGIANTGNTNTTISNAAMGQASVISIPDPGASTANFLISALTGAGTQHITSGALQVDAGAISSGLSTGGFVGVLKAFPTTATSGFMALQAAVNGSGNFGTTLTNQTTQAQAQVLTFPDVGATTGNILAAGAALVSGNLPKASGTSGAIIDSGITAASVSGAVTQLGQLYQVSVTFNTAQMVTAYDTPLTIVANPLASQMILVLQASVYTASTGHTAYATGTAPIIQYGNSAHGAGTSATASGLVASDITAATSQVRNLFGVATGALTGFSGLGLYFSNATGDYTGGTGTNITITVVYQLLTATV